MRTRSPVVFVLNKSLLRLAAFTVKSPLLLRHERKEQPFLDLPIRAKPTTIIVTRRRYRCLSCGRTFYEKLSYMHREHFMTERLVSYIGQEAQRRPFAHVAELVGIDEKTVRVIFREATAHLVNQVAIAPIWLGIDEVHLLHKPRCVLTDLKGHHVVDVLRNRNKATVVSWLLRLPGRQNIELACSDMWVPYKEAIRTTLPQAKIVVDRFHVVKLANEAVETVRKAIKQEQTEARRKQLMHDRYLLLRRYADLPEHKRFILDAWLENIPMLKLAHQAKETFCDIYLAQTREEAIEQYTAWKLDMPGDLFPAFNPLLTAVGNWHEEIFNFFSCSRITAGFTENLNSRIKLIQQVGRGYSFETLRVKVLQTMGPKKD
jgi:transposase